MHVSGIAFYGLPALSLDVCCLQANVAHVTWMLVGYTWHGMGGILVTTMLSSNGKESSYTACYGVEYGHALNKVASVFLLVLLQLVRSIAW